MAAMVGFDAVKRVKPSGPPGRYSRPSNDARSLRSAPALNAAPPAPASTSTRAAGSSSNAASPAASSSAVGPLIALRRSGRSMVSTAAAPTRSYRTGGLSLIAGSVLSRHT
jgi:hypothetical protein